MPRVTVRVRAEPVSKPGSLASERLSLQRTGPGVREAERGSDSWAPTPVGQHGWSVSEYHSALPIGDFDWLLATLLKRSSLKSRLRNSPEKKSEIFISPLSQHSCRLSQGVFGQEVAEPGNKSPLCLWVQAQGTGCSSPCGHESQGVCV